MAVKIRFALVLLIGILIALLPSYEGYRFSSAPTLRSAIALPAQSIKSEASPSLAGLQVKALDGSTVSLADELEKNNKRTLLAVLTHFADFNCWEMVMNLQSDLDQIMGDNSTQIMCVGIGSTEAAKHFAAAVEMDNARLPLFCDESGAVSAALGCYKGLLHVDRVHRERWPATDVSPILKLLLMCAGVGSPGTLQRVIAGYTGDLLFNTNGAAGRKWVTDGLLLGTKKQRWPPMSEQMLFENVPIDSALRPFELATLRLQVGLHILKHWRVLSPRDEDLLTRMGGVFLFEKGAADESNISFRHFDTGICAYIPREELLAAVKR